MIFNPDEINQVQTLGNVARYTQAQPRGSFVNNSNTDVSNAARSMAAGAIDHITGTPVVGMVNRGVTAALEKKAGATQLRDILSPAAGATTPGPAQEFLTRAMPVMMGRGASVPLASILSQYPSRRTDQ